MTKRSKNVLSAADLKPAENRVHLIRGKRVMLDRDAAAVYNVKLAVLNQAIKRNLDRFPKDFMFQLTKKEAGGSKKRLPYAFTAEGLMMLSTVLNNRVATQVNTHIVREVNSGLLN